MTASNPTQSSLFGHLAAKFAASEENLATEALHYLLDRSSIAKRAFLRYVGETGISLPDDLFFQTQVGGVDSAIPDLVGHDATGTQLLIVEAKFWAGLTGNQPVTYLRRLPPGAPGILLFLAPAQRFPTLWPELKRLCHEQHIVLGDERGVTNELLAVRVDTHHFLALASWRSVLAFLLRTLEVEGQQAQAEDVRQLVGLCTRMDDRAFLPLRTEELTDANIPARVVQYSQLADDVTDKLRVEKLISSKGLRATGAKGWYGRYMRIGDFAGLLHFSAWKWRDRQLTPLWLSLYDVRDEKWLPATRAKERLVALEMADPPRLLVVNDEITIPLFLPTGVERATVVEALLRQMREVIDLLNSPTT
ncbi:MAG TPA: hypothetical protein VIL85_25720 [Thermomicrobiales bacterium]|jgi:hypothetical protein